RRIGNWPPSPMGRVHDGEEAQAAADALGARAFAHGRDIWLAEGESQADTALMAHEVTHLLQKDQVVRRKPTTGQQQTKSKKKKKTALNKKEYKPAELEAIKKGMAPATGVLDESTMTITFDSIGVPAFKLNATKAAAPVTWQKFYQRGNTRQVQVWRKDISTAGMAKKLAELAGVNAAKAGEPMAFQVKGGEAKGDKKRYLFGTAEEIAGELTIPTWDKDHLATQYQVDHIIELQLAAWGGAASVGKAPKAAVAAAEAKAAESGKKQKGGAGAWANTVENMQLLEQSVNSKSGNLIQQNIRGKAKLFVDQTKQAFGSSIEEILDNYNLVFTTVVTDKAAPKAEEDKQIWTKAKIEAGAHLTAQDVKPTSPSQIAKGLKDKVLIFPNRSGGTPREFLWNPKSKGEGADPDAFMPFTVSNVQFWTETEDKDKPDLGTFTVEIPKGIKLLKGQGRKQSITVKRLPGALRLGYPDKKGLESAMNQVEFAGMSPIRIDEFWLDDKGAGVMGAVETSLPLFGKKLDLDLTISGGNIMVSHTFTIDEFGVPAPFHVTACSLTFGLGTGGIGVGGKIAFGIDGVGTGTLEGAYTPDGGPTLAGSFSFDTDLFEEADIDFGYNKDGWFGSGKLTVAQVRGVKKGTVQASYQKGLFTLAGAVEPDFPFVKKAEVNAAYSEKDGLLIDGTVELDDKVPLVKSGTIKTRMKKDETGWQLSADGTIPLKLPGDPVVHAAYDQGAWDVSGSISYKKGMLSGTLTAGATNRPLDAAGKPVAGAKPASKMQAYGEGTLTAKLSPWLQATVGAHLKPNGEVELMGELALPKSLELFKERKVDKEIFHIGIDIPIVGVSVLGQRIGIFATIGGGLSAYAGFGPGKLTDTALTVKYNPDREAETEVKGKAKLVVPAGAGVTLSVDGSLGAGIPVVSARAGLKLGGTLALTGEATAAVVVDWTPARGLKVDAEAAVRAQPSFIFDITGFVKVEADLLFDTVNLYEKDWKLASFAYGSGLTFGIKCPIHYEEGKEFDVKLSDVQFEVPDIQPKALLTDLIKKIA
ncbi:MAG: DUF4157 domain-containing protein, partial [Mycobacterium leprae]